MERFLNGQSLVRTKFRVDVSGTLVLFFTILLVIFFAFNALVSVCSVDGNSMNRTLYNNETLLMERNVINLNRGDIVTIGGLSDFLIIKRIIGLSGDKLVFRQSPTIANRVELFRSINGGQFTLVFENYINSPMTTFGWGLNDTKRLFKSDYRLAPAGTQLHNFDEYAIIIGNGECFVMGDNRGDSSDSRYYGLGKIQNIEGRMFYKVPKNSPFEKLLLFIYRERK